MIVQIYTAQSVEEALVLAEAGVDHVGITVSDRGLPGEIELDMGREIVEALRGRATSVALTVDTDLIAVEMFAAAVHPDILHLCGSTVAFPPAAVADLRAWMQRRRLGIELMQAIPVTGEEAVAEARRFARHVDWLILDSMGQVEGIGAAGTVHDWRISREIVVDLEVPVILAGGLGPDNVAEAIRVVRPAGVDSLTSTNRAVAGGGFRKDLDAVTRFVAVARSAG